MIYVIKRENNLRVSWYSSINSRFSSRADENAKTAEQNRNKFE